MNKINIGDVVIVPAYMDNPYLHLGSNISTSRKVLLQKFKDKRLDKCWQAWYAPAGGGARKITADEVEWEGME